MNKSERLRITELYYRMSEHGFSFEEMETIRKASLQLHRWSERECNEKSDVAVQRKSHNIP